MKEDAVQKDVKSKLTTLRKVQYETMMRDEQIEDVVEGKADVNIA